MWCDVHVHVCVEVSVCFVVYSGDGGGKGEADWTDSDA